MRALRRFYRRNRTLVTWAVLCAASMALVGHVTWLPGADSLFTPVSGVSSFVLSPAAGGGGGSVRGAQSAGMWSPCCSAPACRCCGDISATSGRICKCPRRLTVWSPRFRRSLRRFCSRSARSACTGMRSAGVDAGVGSVRLARARGGWCVRLSPTLVLVTRAFVADASARVGGACVYEVMVAKGACHSVLECLLGIEVAKGARLCAPGWLALQSRPHVSIFRHLR